MPWTLAGLQLFMRTWGLMVSSALSKVGMSLVVVLMDD